MIKLRAEIGGHQADSAASQSPKDNVAACAHDRGHRRIAGDRGVELERGKAGKTRRAGPHRAAVAGYGGIVRASESVTHRLLLADCLR